VQKDFIFSSTKHVQLPATLLSSQEMNQAICSVISPAVTITSSGTTNVILHALIHSLQLSPEVVNTSVTTNAPLIKRFTSMEPVWTIATHRLSTEDNGKEIFVIILARKAGISSGTVPAWPLVLDHFFQLQETESCSASSSVNLMNTFIITKHASQNVISQWESESKKTECSARILVLTPNSSTGTVAVSALALLLSRNSPQQPTNQRNSVYTRVTRVSISTSIRVASPVALLLTLPVKKTTNSSVITLVLALNGSTGTNLVSLVALHLSDQDMKLLRTIVINHALMELLSTGTVLALPPAILHWTEPYTRTLICVLMDVPRKQNSYTGTIHVSLTACIRLSRKRHLVNLSVSSLVKTTNTCTGTELARKHVLHPWNRELKEAKCSAISLALEKNTFTEPVLALLLVLFPTFRREKPWRITVIILVHPAIGTIGTNPVWTNVISLLSPQVQAVSTTVISPALIPNTYSLVVVADLVTVLISRESKEEETSAISLVLRMNTCISTALVLESAKLPTSNALSALLHSVIILVLELIPSSGTEPALHVISLSLSPLSKTELTVIIPALPQNICSGTELAHLHAKPPSNQELNLATISVTILVLARNTSIQTEPVHPLACSPSLVTSLKRRTTVMIFLKQT
jgi:hypothetical protein